jgi:hypothetical protein
MMKRKSNKDMFSKGQIKKILEALNKNNDGDTTDFDPLRERRRRANRRNDYSSHDQKVTRKK